MRAKEVTMVRIYTLELPLIIEFYDEPEKVKIAIQALKSRLDFKHIISWPAMVYID
jgi:PII-like signaling protein